MSLETDYQRTVRDARTRMLPGTSIEIVGQPVLRQPPRHALFDFDGTLSLIREGWPEVMIPMMVRILQQTGTRETPEQLNRLVNDFVMQLNGKQTIYQTMRLAEEVQKRGGTPLEPLAYKQMYHDLLMERIEGRREALRTGRSRPEEMLVLGAFDLLKALVDRGVQVYLASGTDEMYVKEEAALLTLDRFFGPRIYGAVDDHRSFSKAMVIERILRENKIDGSALVGFGDGYVEIQNIKEAGGLAIAVASDEAGRSGRPDPWKRDRLIGVGADVVIPDFREAGALVNWIWSANTSV